MTAVASRGAVIDRALPGGTAPSGDTPPNDLDAEASVVGAMMMSPTAVDEVAEVLDATDFYRGAHRTIYEAIMRLRDAGEPVDLVTVSDELRRHGHLEDVGGAVAIVDLLSRTPTAANALYYSRIVADCALRRRLLGAASQIGRMALHPDPSATAAEVADQAEALLHEYATRRTPGELTALPRALADQLARLDALEGTGPVTGLATGYADLDRLTTGLQPGSLVLLAARPGLGKTALAVNIATHVAARLHRPVALFSLEMSCAELVQRILAAEARVPLARLRTGQLSDPDWSAISTAVGRLADAPLQLDDSPGLSAADVRARSRRLQRGTGLALVVVDYLQLLVPPRRMDNHASELAETSRALKLLAKELEVPVLALSQLSRRPEERADRRPQLADLRGSGGLEQDADLVWLLSRDDTGRGGPAGLAELVIAKQRNGPLGAIRLVFDAQHTRFAPASTREPPP